MSFLKKIDRVLRKREQFLAYKHTFGTAQGKEVLFDLMNKYHIINTHKGDVFAEGQRSVVLDILYHLNINLNEYDRLMSGENNGNSE